MNDYKYTFEELNDSRILDLRVIARSLGVERPTTLDKNSLISKILEQQEKAVKGENVNAAPESKKGRGRPPRKALVTPTMGYNKENILCEPTGLEGAFDDTEDLFTSSEEEAEPETTEIEVREEPKEERKFVKERKNQHRESERPERNGNKSDEDDEKQESSDDFPIIIKEGVLEIMPDGYGFLRARNCEPGEGDAYIAAPRIKRCGLRKGDYIKAETKKQTENRPGGVINVLEINGRKYTGTPLQRRNFDSLTPIYPDMRLRLEIPGQKNDYAIRAIDLISPIGKGQRGMIVSPPKAGKTTLLKKIANSISTNYPDIHLLVLLIDERPEEVTDMQRSIKGEVIYSTFDEVPEHHTKAAEMVLERAKRLVELGDDVVILMDSLTRLARANNLVVSPTGRTLSGGIDPGALHSPKRFFGAARNIENGGSLTIIATALVETGSKMDDVIFEEFKGTGNMEIHLDRKLSEKRIFPAIDLNKSGTRREELLLEQKELESIWGMRKMLSSGANADAAETLINMLIRTGTNREFIEQLNTQLATLARRGYTVR